MRDCFVLLCLLATQTACSSTAQKRVIKNFVNSLDEIDLNDPQWQNILEKIATKSDSKSTCLFFKNNKCLLPLRRKIERQKRKSNIKIRPFFWTWQRISQEKVFPKCHKSSQIYFRTTQFWAMTLQAKLIQAQTYSSCPPWTNWENLQTHLKNINLRL